MSPPAPRIASPGTSPFTSVDGLTCFSWSASGREPTSAEMVLGSVKPAIHPADRGVCKRQLVRSFTKRWARTVRYRSHDLAPASLLVKQADSLAGVFRQEGNYHPYHMKWEVACFGERK